MTEYAWGSSQYDTLASLFHTGMERTFDIYVDSIKFLNYDVNYEINEEMVEVLKNDTLGKMFTAWKNSSKDLWYALRMAEELLFDRLCIIDRVSNLEIEPDHSVRQAMVAVFAYETDCIKSEDSFKNFDT